MFSTSTFTSLLLLAASAAADLGNDLSGSGIQAVFPDQEGYLEASAAFNQRFTFSPSVVSFPTSADDVSKIVKIGAANGVKVVARSGGHSYVANGLGGTNGTLVVDLSNLKQISVDSSSNIATIETGNRLGNVAVALNNAGRALPHGTCPYVGIGGHSAFGGFGFTSRMWGLTLDTIQAVNTVLANGTAVRVTADNYPDLFFALRGAAPSYGITTSVEVETFPAPTYSIVYSYTWDMDVATASQALLDWQSFSAETSDLPAEFGGELTLTKGPTEGTINYKFIGGWYGKEGGLEDVIKPFLDKLPEPKTNDRLGNGTYIDSVKELGGSLDLSGPDGSDTFYAKSLITPTGELLTKEAATSFISYLANEGFHANSTSWFMQVELYGGPNSQINAVPEDSSAFVRRDTLFTWQLYASSADNKPPYPADGLTFVDGVANSVVGAMPKDWDWSAYANYIDIRLQDWQTRYYGKHYPRLESIKKDVDPNGVFTFPTSIE